MLIVKSIDIIGLIISALMLLYSLRGFKEFSARMYFYWFYWVIFVVPLWLDYLIGKPDYSIYGSRMLGFSLSYDDTITRITYVLFLVFTQLIILFHRPGINISFINKKYLYTKEESTNREISIIPKRMVLICFAICAITPILCSLFGFPQILFTFGWRERGLFQEFNDRGVDTYVEEFSYIGVTLSLLILGLRASKEGRRNLLYKLYALIFFIINVNTQSKRAIVFFTVIVAIYIFFLTHKNINIFKVAILMLSIGIAVLAGSIFVKSYYRGYSGFYPLYTSTRIDFFRDDTVKLAIYSVLHPKELHILSYPFESYLMQIRFFFLISLLAGKQIISFPGMGFNHYLTAALLMAPVSNEKFMTVSMFDEAIANFGLLGIIVIAIALSYLLKFIDKLPKYESVLWISFIILYSMFSLDYILIYFEVIVLIHIYMKIKLRL